MVQLLHCPTMKKLSNQPLKKQQSDWDDGLTAANQIQRRKIDESMLGNWNLNVLCVHNKGDFTVEQIPQDIYINI